MCSAECYASGVRRYDSAPIPEVLRLPSGGAKIPAALTRSGVFVYQTPTGPRREWRPPKEVFAPESLETLRGAPVTVGHPRSGVTASSWRALAVGHGGDDVRRDGELVAATVYVHDADALEAIESGEAREISLGYDTEFVERSGITPEGEAYDGVQTRIVYNHIALVPRGRAGREVSLRLDAAGDQEITPVKIEIIDGTEYEVGSAEHTAAKAARARRDAEDAALVREARAIRRSHLIERVAAKVKGFTARADAGEDQIMLDALKRMAPNFSVEGRSPEFIAGAFAMALEMMMPPAAPEPAEEPEMEREAPVVVDGAQGAEKVRSDAARKTEDPELSPAEKARAEMIRRGSTIGKDRL